MADRGEAVVVVSIVNCIPTTFSDRQQLPLGRRGGGLVTLGLTVVDEVDSLYVV